jgi:hypothetical protein
MLFYLLCMTMFDEMEVGIHLPIGNLTLPQLDISVKDALPSMDHKHHHHHHHDEESQVYSQRISLPIQR